MDEQDIDLVLEPALDSIDRATLALHLSRMACSHADRVDQARQAYATFEAALQTLLVLPRMIRRTTTWQHWVAEARHGRTLAGEDIDRLGA